MSKNTKTALIVGAALLCLGIITAGIAYAIGARPQQVLEDASFEIDPSDFGFGFGKYGDNDRNQNGSHITGPAKSDGSAMTEEKTGSSFTAVPVSDMDIEINWVAGNIEILRWDKDEILIEETANKELSSNQRMRCSVSKNGKKLQVDYNSGNIQIGIFVNMPTKHLTVTLPYDVDIYSFSIDGTSCDTRIEEELTVKDFSFSTTSGALTANISADDFEFDSVSGDANIVGLFREIEIDTTSGGGKIACLNAPDTIEFDTVSGDAAISLPRDTGFRLEFDSVSGDFESSIPTVRSGGNYTAGDGHAQIDYDSVSGDLNIFYS